MKFAIILLLWCATLTVAVDTDYNTFSNYRDVRTDHIHLEWLLDLDQKHINATAEYTFTALTILKEVHLDIYQMNVHFCYMPLSGKILTHQVQQVEEQSLTQGDRLVIKLQEAVPMGSQFKLRIRYVIDERARALSFMTPEQTDDKGIYSVHRLEAPFLFSQCEANNCRSMLPLQDSPSVKFTYSATILTLDPKINVFMSGVPQQKLDVPLLQRYDAQIANIFHFSLDIKIPGYLIAIVAGTVQEEKTGQFTSVISEKKNLMAYKAELSELDSFVQKLEEYIGPYKWKAYKIVILPASFPFGGMENPLLTFANPTIMVGDKSGLSVAVHEIAHSWFGNTVTCNNWSNMWINEGFCVFLERKGLEKLYDKDFVLTNALIGNQDYLNARQGFLDAKQDSYASLHPETKGENPDDSFSTIPYEKGFQLLYYLESQIGVENFQKLLKAWLAKFEYKSADWNDFYLFMVNWVEQNDAPNASKIRAEIDRVYERWVMESDLPPVPPNFSNPSSRAATNLAESWISSDGREVPQDAHEYDTFQPNQKQLFLSTLLSQARDVKASVCALMQTTYDLDATKDSEIKFRWFTLAIMTGYSTTNTNQALVKTFVGSVGRQKMVLPIYRQIQVDLGWAWYNEFKAFYHPLARQSIESVLKSRMGQPQMAQSS